MMKHKLLIEGKDSHVRITEPVLSCDRQCQIHESVLLMKYITQVRLLKRAWQIVSKDCQTKLVNSLSPFRQPLFAIDTKVFRPQESRQIIHIGIFSVHTILSQCKTYGSEWYNTSVMDFVLYVPTSKKAKVRPVQIILFIIQCMVLYGMVRWYYGVWCRVAHFIRLHKNVYLMHNDSNPIIELTTLSD